MDFSGVAHPGNGLHNESHPLSGATVRIKTSAPVGPFVTGALFEIEDWWDIMAEGRSWQNDFRPAASQYRVRSSLIMGPPEDDRVVYGKINGLGYIAHEDELDKVVW